MSGVDAMEALLEVFTVTELIGAFAIAAVVTFVVERVKTKKRWNVGPRPRFQASFSSSTASSPFKAIHQTSTVTSPFFQNTSQSVFSQFPFPLSDSYLVVLSNIYHGTRSFENAVNILNFGWRPGPGSQFGRGIYFGDWNTARSYAGDKGCLVGATIRIKELEIIDYEAIQQFPNCPRNGEGLTAYALSRGYRVIRASPSIYVVLARNHSTPRHIPGVTIKGVYSPATGRKII